MNRTNRSIAALFILTTLAVQPVATHAMAGRVAQAAKQGFNAAKQFASYHNLGGKAKTAAKTTALLSPVGYVIADPLHCGSIFNAATGTYVPSTYAIARAGIIGSKTVMLTWATGILARVAKNAKLIQSGPNTRSRFIGSALAMAAKNYIDNDNSRNKIYDENQRDYLRRNPQFMYPSKPGFNWDTWRRLHDQCVAHKDSSLK